MCGLSLHTVSSAAAAADDDVGKKKQFLPKSPDGCVPPAFDVVAHSCAKSPLRLRSIQGLNHRGEGRACEWWQ